MSKSQIYLISPPEIDLEEFSANLQEALATKKIPVFQLRLKDISEEQILEAATHLIKICHKYQTLFILNDNLDLALKIGADGVHLGSDDGNISKARQRAPEGFVIGASCYDSKDAIMRAAESGADYISIGAFFPSKTKQSIGKPGLEILKWCAEYINLPIVTIGGIDDKNYKQLTENGADFLAIISYIWDHPKGVVLAIDNIDL